MDRIPVLFCTDGVFPHGVGGMQRHSRLLVEELARQGETDITVVHPHDEQVFDESLGIKEIKLEGLNPKKIYLRECKRYSARMLEVVKQHPNHVVYSQGLSVWEGIKSVANRVIVNPHGLEPYQALGRKDKLVAIPFKKVFDKIFNTAGTVISLGGGLTTILESRIRDTSKIVVLPNATVLQPDAVQRSMPGVKEPLKFVFVSRFAANKGIPVLIEAIRQLNQLGLQDQLEFHFAGKGPLYDEYREQHQLPNVHYRGFVSDEELLDLYHTSHCFVLPTLFEGMPTVVLEAMAWRLPIIVTDVGATAEQVDETNGYLIERNNVEQLVGAIRAYHDLDAAHKNALSEGSFKRLKDNFIWPIVAKRHTELFRTVQSRMA